MKRICIFKCGCETEIKKTKVYKINSQSIIACKKHKQGIESCRFECDCGNIEHYKRPHNIAQRKNCSICANKNHYYNKIRASHPIIRIHKCGCRYSGLPVYLYCPEHKEPIVLRKKVCIVCKKEFEIKQIKRSKTKCPNCLAKIVKKKKEAMTTGIKRNEWQPEQKTDCAFYEDCLMESLKTNKRKRCVECTKYKQITLDVLDFFYARDSFSVITKTRS